MRSNLMLQYAVRFSYTQGSMSGSRPGSDKLVYPFAVVLAGLGITLSSFSVKQLLAAGHKRTF